MPPTDFPTASRDERNDHSVFMHRIRAVPHFHPTVFPLCQFALFLLMFMDGRTDTTAGGSAIVPVVFIDRGIYRSTPYQSLLTGSFADTSPRCRPGFFDYS
jgi:hypothetical protein